MIEDTVKSILDNHVGRANSIKARTLFYRVNAAHPESPIKSLGQLRDIIHSMRQKGELIASGNDGYFRPETLDEAMEYVDRQLRAPSRDQLMTARIQREAARSRFGGQMRMPI